MGGTYDMAKEKKESFGQKIKKHLKRKIIIAIISTLLVTIITTVMIFAMKRNVDMVLQSAMNLFSIWDDEEEKETIEIYHVNANNGVSDCKLRPKTGVYPGTSGSTGLGVSSGKLPDGVPTLKEMMDFELKMYEHTKVKYKAVTDKIGDKQSDGTGVGHVFSYPNDKSSWWVKKHNNKTYGYTDKSAGGHGQKLVVDNEYPFAYGTLDFNDNRKHTTDSGNGNRWPCGHTGNGQKNCYEHLGAYIRTYGRYDHLNLDGAQGKLQGKWRTGGSKSKGGLAQFDCPDGVTRYGAVMKFTMGMYLYNKSFEAGDYIDVYYTDGTIDHYILQDSKGQENESFLMHNEGTVIEMYTTKSSSGNLLNDIVKDRKGMQIAGFVKTGNYFNDAKCEKEYKVTWKDGKPGTGDGVTVELPETGPTTIEHDGTQYVYLDGNGNPCTPEGGEKAPTVPSGGSGGWEKNFGAVPGRRTLKNFLATSLSCMGRVTYMYGGGQGNAPHIGTLGFDKLFPTYKNYHDRNIENTAQYQDNRGLDCCGFVKWAVYNTFETVTGKGNKYGAAHLADTYEESLAKLGFGTLEYKKKRWANCDLKPGDIVSADFKYIGQRGAHIWTVIGKSGDGGYVMVHSPKTGTLVHLSGTSRGAAELAKKYNDIVNVASTEVMGNKPVDWFPAGAGRGTGKFGRGSDWYDNHLSDVFRWHYNNKGLEDPDGISNMSAEQVLELIIGDGKASPISTTTEGETGKGAGAGRTIFLDPGHGIGNPSTSGADMSALGFVKNGSSWGEWRHYDSTGLEGTMCNDCKKDASHSCWYPLSSALRDKEPELTYSIAEETKKLLEKAGYKVVMSRTKDEFPSITKRAKLAKDAGADIQICIHTNASNGSARGVAYCSPEGGDKGVNKLKTKDWKSKSNKLNQLIYDGIIKNSSLGKYGTGVIKNYGYLVLYEKASCPTAYLEVGFHDNAEDLKILENKEEVKKIAQGIVAGVNSYYGG